jgi:sugar-specific transcriptional regulator TrmB
MKKVLQSETEKVLLDAGFSEKEIAIYVALLSIGKGIVTKISRTASISRTTTYDILDSLSQKGLIRISGKEPKQEYIVEPPEKLEKFISEEIEKKNNNLIKIKDIIPELRSVYTEGERPKIKFYEGLDGLAEVYDDTLTAKETIVAYACYENMEPLLPKYFETYYKRRVAKKISARGIVPETPMAIEHKRKDQEEMRELSLVPKDKYYFTPDIEIYDNKVMIASWKEKLGIIIESAEISDAMKKIFELAWIGAKHLKNNDPLQ